MLTAVLLSALCGLASSVASRALCSSAWTARSAALCLRACAAAAAAAAAARRRRRPEMLTAVLLSALCGLASSVFLRVDGTQRRCFTEDLPDRTRLVGVYWTRLYDEQRDEYLPVDPDLEINVVATDPDEQLILSGSSGSEGRFTFTSRRPGEHQICLQSNSSQRPLPAGGTLALHLHVSVGDRTNDYADIAARDKLTELQLRVRQLTEQVYQIQKEQDYHRLRVNDLRHVNFSTNKWVFWWVVIRTLYMVAVVTWNPSW